jgi:hypothetical protein
MVGGISICLCRCGDVKGIQSTLMRTFTTLLIVALLVVMLALMACGGGNQELPGIEGTAESIIPESWDDDGEKIFEYVD